MGSRLLVVVAVLIAGGCGEGSGTKTDATTASTANSGRSTVTVRIALGNNGQDESNGGVSGRGHFTAAGAIVDRGSATTYRTVKGSIPGGVITLRIVTVGKKGAITYLVTIDTGTGTSRWKVSSGTKAYDGVHAHGVERENAAHTTSTLIGTVSR